MIGMSKIRVKWHQHYQNGLTTPFSSHTKGSIPLVPTISPKLLTSDGRNACSLAGQHYFSFQSTYVLPVIFIFIVAVESNLFFRIACPGVAVPLG